MKNKHYYSYDIEKNKNSIILKSKRWETNSMKEIINKDDIYQMNWIEGNTEWGTVKCPDELTVSTDRKITDDIITESYTFTNISNIDVFTSLKDISIYTPFNDNYTSAQTCLTNRCHTHIFCAENISYIMALRMGGKPKHLGLVLTQGSLGGYSVERNIDESSNDRGDFILHPSPTTLMPGESFTISWTLFWHDGKEDFYKKIKYFNPNFIEVNADNFTLFENENIKLKITPSFNFISEDVFIKADNFDVKYKIKNNQIIINQPANIIGEIKFKICIKGIETHCNILVLPKFEDLLFKRCKFIVEKQQYHNEDSGLNGAFLAYDNEEQHMCYKYQFDFNGGRERVVMGILLARFLRYNTIKNFEDALKKYTTYVERELFDVETGIVYNDYNHSKNFNRLYNYSWISILYIELYNLYGDIKYISYAYRALNSFYEQGGYNFYAFPIPMVDIIKCLEKANLLEEKINLLKHFYNHSEFIIKNGLEYPPHEVKFEQSIAFPATDILLQMFELTNEDKYLENAKYQLKALELFACTQPDYHLYEVAIRHWDGFWFGKKQMYGDTFPHYWSSLNGIAYQRYANIIKSYEYSLKAESSLRGSMSLFNPDGSASCACVFPISVNGKDANFYDPMANDQDWAMYFMLCHITEKLI